MIRTTFGSVDVIFFVLVVFRVQYMCIEFIFSFTGLFQGLFHRFISQVSFKVDLNNCCTQALSQ